MSLIKPTKNVSKAKQQTKPIIKSIETKEVETVDVSDIKPLEPAIIDENKPSVNKSISMSDIYAKGRIRK